MNKLLGELSFVVHLSRTSGQVLINQSVLHNDPYSIGCVMVTMVISSLDLVYDIGIYCFSVKDAALRSGWSRDNVSEWIDMSTRRLLFLWNQDNMLEWIDMSTRRLLFLWNKDNVSEWIDISTRRLLFQWNHDNVSEWIDMSTRRLLFL